MASSHSPTLPANPIRFFKIILSDTASHAKLMIPRKISRIFEKNLLNRVYLNVPNGSVWSVDLEKHKDKVWMQNGWPEFAKYYSISFGYLLVFECKGDSKFEVLIFDPSALEIDYPLTCSANLDYVKSTQVTKKEICLTDAAHSEAIRPRKKTRANSAHSEAIRPPKKTRSNSAHLESCHNEQKLGNEKGTEEKRSALVLAKAFKSEKPFFILSVQPSHLDTSRVHIPMAFREVYTKWMNNVEVILKVGRRTWPVYSHLNTKWKRCTFSAGWLRFAQDNSLNVGDVCVFELINPTTKLFNVFMFRATAEAR